MTGTHALIGATLTLAAGTFAFRLAGLTLRSRINLPPAVGKLTERATVVLLTTLVLTTALFDAHAWAGTARPAGVLVGGVLAWRKAPFLVVTLGAAGSTALLRLLGAP